MQAEKERLCNICKSFGSIIPFGATRLIVISIVFGSTIGFSTTARAQRASARSIQAGLALVKASGASVLAYYDALGAAYVDIDPNAAPKLRASRLIDYFEPDLGGREIAGAGLSKKKNQ